ncbi:hypothetical protein L1887_18711 [Cichorium endivia]|nr:hypothetical protein L1887_18711 [Cichorium endivia]
MEEGRIEEMANNSDYKKKGEKRERRKGSGFTKPLVVKTNCIPLVVPLMASPIRVQEEENNFHGNEEEAWDTAGLELDEINKYTEIGTMLGLDIESSKV